GSQARGMLSFRYTLRDDLGRLLAATESRNEGGVASDWTLEYTYDAQGRLTDVKRNGIVIEHYAYDANGNRIHAAVEGRPTITSRKIVHDARDRLTQYGDLQLSYNDQDQLVRRERRVMGGIETTR